MSLLKKIGKAVKKGGKALGKIASKAAPLVAMVPGVGTVGGALLGAGGALVGGESMGTALRRGAMGAAGGLAGGAVRGALGLGGGAARAVGTAAVKKGALNLAGKKLAGSMAGKVLTGGAKAGISAAGKSLATRAAGTAMRGAATRAAGRAFGGGRAGGMGAGGSYGEPSAPVEGTAFDVMGGPPSLLSRVGRAAGSVAGGIGRGALNLVRDNPALVLQGGLAAAGTMQGAQQQGEADALRRRALDLGLEETAPQPGTFGQYIDPTNPYAAAGPGMVSPARRAARRALSGY